MKSGEKVSKELYVTDEHGEVIDIIESTDKYVKLSEGDKVVRKGVLQYLNDTVDLKYHFVKVNPNVYGDIANKCPILNILIDYMGYMDGIISYKNGKIIRIKDIPKICNVSEATAKRQIKTLIELDVIHKIRGKPSYFVINPYVAYRGRKIYLSLYEEFKFTEYKNLSQEWSK